MEDFSGKTVIVTGAASGLGRATAVAFAKRNANLVVADVTAEGLDELALELEGQGTTVLSRPGDLSTRAACYALIEAGVGRFGGIDTLCNVAGMLAPSRVEDVTEDIWERLMAINLGAPFWLAQAALPSLVARNGSIVNIASTGGLRGQAYTVPYSASKAGLIHMTKSMALEYMNRSVRINAIAPGPMDTEGIGQAMQFFPQDAEQNLVDRLISIRPAAEPAMVADLIVYLASDRAVNIHGACFTCDGGTTTS